MNERELLAYELVKEFSIEGGPGMSERLHAARMAIQLETWNREYSLDLAHKALAAADAVMFSDEAVERAAKVIYQAAAKFAYENASWDEVDPEAKEVWIQDARNVIAALKGAGDE